MSLLRQHYALTAVTTDGSEPVTIQEVRQYSRISDPDDDVWIRSAIRAARMMVEKATHRQLITKTYDLTLDEFPGTVASIPLPRPPLQSVSSVTYVTSTGGSTTVDSTSLLTDTASEPGRVSPVYNATWPTPRAQNNAVTIQYIAGYGDAAEVPEPLKQAILMLVGHWYENRETAAIGSMKEVPFAFDALCGSYRFGSLH